MKACIPVAKDRGLESAVFPHFGSAPVFLVVDTSSRTVTAHRSTAALPHGRCHALDAVGGERIDAAVVGNIGAGALERFRAAGIPVYRSSHATVGEIADALAAGALPRLDEGTCLGGHQGGAHAPGRGHRGGAGGRHGPGCGHA